MVTLLGFLGVDGGCVGAWMRVCACCDGLKMRVLIGLGWLVH